MSFFSKIKQGLGIGTLDAKLSLPAQIAANSGQFEGDFLLTAKSDQHIQEIKVVFEMVRHWDETKHRRDSNGRDESYTSHETQSTELGRYSDKTPIDIKADETKTVHFAVQFQPFSTQTGGNAANQGTAAAVLGAISMLASTMRNERIEYKVSGTVDLKGVALDPHDSKNVFVG